MQFLAEGEIDIQIRDFDQTVIGNPAHDLIRLALSLTIAARGSDLPGVTTAKMVEQLIDGYEQEFNSDCKEMPPEERPSCVQVVMKQALTSSWKHLAEDTIDDNFSIKIRNPSIFGSPRAFKLASSVDG